jgi:hypothetical protein
LDELDAVPEDGDENEIKAKEIKKLGKKIDELEDQNKILEEKNAQLEAKNKKIGEQVKRLHEASKKNADQILNSEDKIDNLEDEIESFKEKLSITEKELELYKKKLKTEEEKNAKNFEKEGKLTDFEKLLEEKNKRIVDLELQIKSLKIQNRKSFREISSIKPKSVIPLKTPEKPKSPEIMIRSAVSIQSDLNKKNVPDEKPIIPNIDDNSLPLELMLDIDMLKKKQNEDNQKHNTLFPSPSNSKQMKRRKSQRDAMKDLNNIDFGVSSAKKTNPANPFEVFDKHKKSMSSFRKPKKINKKIFEKSKQLKIVIQKPENKFGESSKKKKLVYSYDHLNIVNNPHIAKIIEKNEHILLQTVSARLNFRCLSDNVYRLNKWKNKKPKIIIITSRYLYLLTPPHDVKRILKLSDIRSVKTRGRQDNFVCFMTRKGHDEMVDYFKKNELLLYITALSKKKNYNIKINTDVTKFQMMNTDGKDITVDPNKLQKFKPIYNNTFNYASERDRLMNIFVWEEKFFGLTDDYVRRVALITDLGILLFSNVQWNLERFVPFGGTLSILLNNRC